MNRYIKNKELFLENSNNNTSRSKNNMNLITDLCISMTLINPGFLDNILDKGRKSRYTQNTTVFLNDLKNLVTSNNRLRLGIKDKGKKYVEDDNVGKVNSFFNEHSQDFDMEKDWVKLNKARDIARNIQKNLIADYELSDQSIKTVLWIGPNRDTGEKVDIVVEIKDGKQYPIVFSKMNVSKTQSFNTVMDLMLGQQADKLFTDQYLDSWDKLTQEWFKLLYENVKHELKIMIDQFIDATRGDSLTYFEYFGITIQDPKYQHLGKYVSPLNKNYKELHKLLSDIWKEGDKLIDNFSEVEKEWIELKKIILNSKIIEHLIIDSLNNLIDKDSVGQGEENYILSENKVKMRLMKVLVNLLNVTDIDNYYCTKTELYHIPTRQWFRDNYDDMTLEYDYHQRVSSEDNDSQFRIKLKLGDKSLMTMELFTGFRGGEMSGNLNTKMEIEYVSDWNSKIKD